jgi:hypothetical protein
MKKFNKKRGQSSVEYILIIAAVVGVIFMFGKQFRTRIESTTNSLFGGVDKNVNSLTGGQ